MTQLVLVRGAPGSGKSTFAKLLTKQGYLHLETDQYRLINGVYVYDRSKNGYLHSLCLEDTSTLLGLGRKVVVSNTFTTMRELAPYLALPYTKTVVKVEGDYENTHRVPEETIRGMKRNYEPY